MTAAAEGDGTIGSFPGNRWTVRDTGIDLRRTVSPPRSVDLPAKPVPVVLDLARTALVVVDMQRDFLHPDGWLASIGVDVTPARGAIDPLVRAVPVLRDAGVPVIWLNWGTRADGSNLPPGVLHVYDPSGSGAGIGAATRPGGPPTLQAGSWSAGLVDEMPVAPGDLHVDKHRMSGFFDTPLDGILRTMAVTTVLFAGVNVDQCVYATLVDAACLGYDVILLDDCSATTSPDFCTEATRYNVAQCFGFVADAKDLVRSVAASNPDGTEPGGGRRG